MAFNKQGAYWMSNEREIKNPYFGNEMLNCGSVEDSLDYSK
jgi:Cu(I)/Ag(I) efflux system membrane fusion protein